MGTARLECGQSSVFDSTTDGLGTHAGEARKLIDRNVLLAGGDFRGLHVDRHTHEHRIREVDSSGAGK